MGILGTDADIATDVLILGEIIITVLVVYGVRLIRRNHVHRHRTVMLTGLAFNLVLLASFVVTDIIKFTNTVERGTDAPIWVFIPLLVIHVSIAIGALTLAIVSWRIARRGTVHDGHGRVVNLTPAVREAHRRVSRYYPTVWYATLATGLLLYAVLYFLG